MQNSDINAKLDASSLEVRVAVVIWNILYPCDPLRKASNRSQIRLDRCRSAHNIYLSTANTRSTHANYFLLGKWNDVMILWISIVTFRYRSETNANIFETNV